MPCSLAATLTLPPCVPTACQGPTVSNVYNVNKTSGNGTATLNYYAATICVRKKQLYGAVKALQKVRRGKGESGVCCQGRMSHLPAHSSATCHSA